MIAVGLQEAFSLLGHWRCRWKLNMELSEALWKTGEHMKPQEFHHRKPRERIFIYKNSVLSVVKSLLIWLLENR